MNKAIAAFAITSTLLASIGNVTNTSTTGDTIVYENINGKVSSSPVSVHIDNDALDVNVQNWPEKQILQGTVIRSLNNKYEKALYKPLYNDISFIKDRIVSEADIPVVYTDNFDNTSMTKTATDEEKEDNNMEEVSASREAKILGQDILVYQDDWDSDRGEPSVKSIGVSDNITKELAIIACSKSLGSLKYKLYIKSEPLDKSNTSKVVPIVDTPFINLVQSENLNVNTSKYYTDVYVSRTSPEDYWNDAKNMGIVFNTYKSDLSDLTENVTLGQLALYIKSYMYLNGEPVMTDEEEQYLLGVYGRKLPTYLPSQQLDAVKYLMARGVLDTESDFKTPVNGSKLMLYLMRAKDKDSRLTFKETDIEYDKDLVSAGYYPIDVTSQKVSINNPTITRANSASSTYFDYFVEVNSMTTFKDAKGRAVSNLYVASDQSTDASDQYPGSQYLGVENGFYHFQIPVDIATDSKAIKNNYIEINSGNASDVPKSIKLEYGGGWYKSFTEVPLTKEYSSKRVEFSYIDGGEYIDLSAKELAISELSDRIMLAPNDKDVIYTFDTNNIGEFRWGGKEIPLDGSELDGLTYDANLKRVTITFSGSGTSSAKLLKQKLTVQATGDSVQFPSYINADGKILVSLSFIKQEIENCSVTQMEDNSNVWEISTSAERILVDTANKRIVSGQYIEELGESETSPLIVKYTDGETLIDYRCIKSLLGEHMVLDSSGTVKAIAQMGRLTSDADYQGFKPKTVNPLLGEDTLTYARISSENKLNLEASYSKANFLVYKKSEGGTKYTVLMVFKPKVNNEETSDAVKKELKEKYNIQLSNFENCTMYRLMDSGTELSQSQKSIYTKLPVGDAIQYDPVDGYSYKIPDISTWDFNSYYKTDSPSITSVLPIVRSGSTYIDLNANIFSSLGPYKFPRVLINSTVLRELNISSGIHFNEGSGGYSDEGVYLTDVNNSIQYAPIGLFIQYYDLETKKPSDVKSDKVLYGSMAGTIEDNNKTIKDESNYIFKVNDYELPVYDSDEFYLLNFGNLSNSITYLYKNSDSSQVGNFTNSKFGSALLDKISLDLFDKNIFDWKNFNLLRAFQDFDDILTITLLFILNIIPRLMIMDFFIVMIMSLVARFKVVQYFCHNVIDVYKIVSIRHLTVDEVDFLEIFKSTFWAIVLLSMLQQESLVHLFLWICEMFMKIIAK